MIQKRPIILDNNANEDLVEGEQTMDIMLFYAQNGMAEAEQVMREQPELFSEQEIMDFAANKVVLAKAPDILQEYKKKVQEFSLMHDKVQSVVGKCEKIVRNYEIRKSHDSDNYVDPHKKVRPPEKPLEKPEPGVIRYTNDGQIMMNSSSSANKTRKKISIELPKQHK